ncbi:MAG: efflux RND transporter periplasmic adaptor subunit [Flavobacteriaceae bacterium]|nr:efflux RND transporter periplasmic adaptor subunit [Flavobacteriaceae bacterium]
MKRVAIFLGILLIVNPFLNHIDAGPGHDHEKSPLVGEKQDSHKGQDAHEGHDHGTHEKKKEKSHDEKDAHGHSKEEESKAKLSAKDLKELKITLSQVDRGYLNKTMKYSGELQLNEDRLVHINPRFSGFVREVQKKLGDYVQKGEVLALVDSLEIGEARSNFIEMKRNYELAEQDLQRVQNLRSTFYSSLTKIQEGKSDLSTNGDSLNEAIGDFYKSFSRLSLAKKTWKREQKLFKEKVNSEQSYFAAQSNLEEAQTDFSFQKDQQKYEIERELLQKKRLLQLVDIKFRSSRNKLVLFGLTDQEINDLSQNNTDSDDLTLTSLRAPFAGYIINKHLVVGERISSENSVYTIADLKDYWALFQVYSQDTRKIKMGQNLEVTVAGKSYKAKIDYIGRTINEATRSFDARALIKHDDGLKAGLFLQANVVVDKIEVDLIIPKTSIFDMDGSKVVFVKHDGAYEPKKIQIGREDAFHVEVLSGLKKSDWYVAVGGFHVKAELLKGSLGDGHNH